MTPGERERVNALMKRAADGDRGAVGALFELVWPTVRAFARRALPSSDADDVAQETALRIFERIHQFDPARGDALAWILTICRYDVMTHAKRRSRRREDAIAGEFESGARAPDELAMERDVSDAVHAALAALTPEDRAIVVARMHDIHDDTVAPATMRKRWQRALGRLRTVMGVKHAAR